MNTYSVNQHMPFEFSIIKKPFAAAIMSALEELIPVNSIVLLKGGSITECFPT